MNDVFRHIYMRRSVRDYKQEEVPDEILQELIKAGIYAPSALNEQPWKFVVIKNTELIKRCSDRAKQLWLERFKGLASEDVGELIKLVSAPEFNIFYNAPVLVLIFSRPEVDSPQIDCALAAENMMLAAASIGIGSCWIGLGSPLEADTGLMQEMGVPEGYRLMAQLIFGYPAEKETQAPERNKDVILKWIR